MSAHTPGPWEAVKWQSDCWLVQAGQGEALSNVARAALQTNARLIAAAPELLEALRDMLAGWQYIRSFHGDLHGVGWDRAQGKALAAIAKAESA